MTARGNASQIRSSPCDPRPGDYAAYEDAQTGSNALARECDKLRQRGLVDEAPPTRQPLSFDEQLALVASGRARIVEFSPIRMPAPDRTLGGVSEIT